MRARLAAAVAGPLLALAVVAGPGAPPALAQEVDVPTQDIIPRPNSGEEPEEAGDRGGALQLAIFVLVCAAIGGGGTYVALQSRRVRQAREAQAEAGQPSARIASQAATPSMKPER